MPFSRKVKLLGKSRQPSKITRRKDTVYNSQIYDLIINIAETITATVSTQGKTFSQEKGYPTTRMVLLKDFDNKGFVFYTNLSSDKSKAIINSPKISLCFHWKSLLRQVRILGLATKVSDKEADEYFNSRSYGSKIGAWASNQSSLLKKRENLFELVKNYKKKFPDQDKVPRPSFWSGWRLKPIEIEFWVNGEDRLHERLKYTKIKEGWKKILLNP